ncbi:t-SNARE [Suhomyces tanzawaensis NRRL Y-17324]|uniref:t-SNARE n=1 Tax=Suhomyces tanzawaensis NRRL Y-17324 TaxID=984487 RepID=A0A1E4SGP2_9ASCO|nr:t-SNARE [Suhomyces tanzawaensis NRRL Y-17324]ODV78635.1 t-SNARE [Suhomyces tanzawaensis NRRL Y-17324]
MSFNVFGDDLERTATNASNRYKDYPEFESISTSIDNQLQHINHVLLVAAKEAISDLETDQSDTKSLENVNKSFNRITDSFKKLNSSIKSLNAYITQSESEHEDVEVIGLFKQKETILIKLTKDSLNNFKNCQRRFESLNIANGQDLEAPSTPGNGPSEQLQQQVQISYEPVNAEELEQQTLLIQEREREIHQIHQDTLEINDIFENLSSIVNEQQFQIDSIENNLFSYDADVRNASSELRKAERYQRRSGGRMFCCLIILLGIVAFIILVGVIF